MALFSLISMCSGMRVEINYEQLISLAASSVYHTGSLSKDYKHKSSISLINLIELQS